MDVVYERCAGLDVGKEEVVACVRLPDARGGRRQEIRTFGTFTGQLEELAGWLAGEGVSHVVMEATGPYWQPVWHLLEERPFELLLVNARHVKILPGRKTDVGDAAWLAELLEHGLLRGSFVPPAEIRRAARPDPLSQAADPGPRTGGQAHPEDARRRRHQARLGRERHPGRVGPGDAARTRRRRARPGSPRRAGARTPAPTIPELREALRGRFSDHHALLVRLSLEHVDQLDRSIAELDAEVDRVIAPFADGA